jgi:serine/threonine-protein phosphatase PGAM5
MAHNIILVRHGEHLDAEHGVIDGPLSERGIAQAEAVGKRLAGMDISTIWHSPLERAWETVRVMEKYVHAQAVEPSALLMDCIPSGKTPETPDSFDPFFGSVTDAEIEAGSAQMADAVAEFLGVGRQDTTDLMVTHNNVISWFVREVMDAPDWKWVPLNQAHCGITVLQHRRGRPWALLSHNDVGHLPVELRSGTPGSFTI